MFNKKISLVLLFSLSAYAEISMFGAGALDSKNPYGLTETEKVIVKNKKILSDNQKRIKKVDTSISDLSQRIDGLESIYDGDSQKLNKLYLNFNKHIKDLKEIRNLNKLSDNEQNRKLLYIENSLSDLRDEVKINITNIDNLKKSFDKIVVLVNDINSKYVTKTEFNKLIEILDKKESQKQVSKKNNTPKYNKTKKELIEEVRVLFKKDYFTKALPILEYLIKNNYRPAECNFYVGEIKFYRDKYKDALYFFKKSMLLYDKAKYLPKLLLHSAISFEKTGQDDNALKFYTTLLEVYPDTIEAKEASKKIK
ncbi:MAG: hypothetical protein U9O56_02830 [Campylobacterota bacterium]|nr:hypothetical protein [Campylobacterota bacterium]